MTVRFWRISYFYPRSPCGERRRSSPTVKEYCEFLSTLSLRRATAQVAVVLLRDTDFYPRSPCGERRRLKKSLQLCSQFLSTLSLRRATLIWTARCRLPRISIHALLAESDARLKILFICTISISIHALLAESDLRVVSIQIGGNVYFYPRSPCGERLAYPDMIICTNVISIHALLAESDRHWQVGQKRFLQFLSTLSLRRATMQEIAQQRKQRFLSTLSLRRATVAVPLHRRREQFLSTLSLRRATCSSLVNTSSTVISIHALLAESDRVNEDRYGQQF